MKSQSDLHFGYIVLINRLIACLFQCIGFSWRRERSRLLRALPLSDASRATPKQEQHQTLPDLLRYNINIALKCVTS